tara:strand:+ start:2299 stop:2502 length:204 start_codon:yes stop_codon:yes gene_type:complete
VRLKKVKIPPQIMLRSIRDAQKNGEIILVSYTKTDEKEVAVWEKAGGGYKSLTQFFRCGTIIEENVH